MKKAISYFMDNLLHMLSQRAGIRIEAVPS
jgi:hypothetical protein